MTPRNTGAVFDTLINVWTAMSCGLIASCEARWFFFSSRRRHTRLTGDWSSDVCSSDLAAHTARRPGPAGAGAQRRGVGVRGAVPGGGRQIATGAPPSSPPFKTRAVILSERAHARERRISDRSFARRLRAQDDNAALPSNGVFQGARAHAKDQRQILRAQTARSG